MNYQQAVNKLTSIDQIHILKFWDTLNKTQQQHLLDQIQKLDPSILQQQQRLLQQPQGANRSLKPFNDFAKAGNQEDARIGREIISKGMAGCLIVAGGQGTRLRFNGPKGMFPVTPVLHKSLFQLFAEKIVAAGKQAGRLLPVSMMTSQVNHEETVSFFKEHHFFGLKPEQLSFFSQEMLPLLDQNGRLFLESPDSIAEGPDGNGGALHHFYNSGIWQSWHNQGVQYLNFVLIDNPLADPFDGELIGLQHRCRSDVVIKCISRDDPQESVGVLALENGKIVVVEYSELDEKERISRQSNGTLLYPCANLSLFGFSMEFIKKSVSDKMPMPLHKAFKAVKHINDQGRTVHAEKPMSWKFEKFIFDLLPRANKVDALLYSRERCFSPLKNYSGNFSIDTVRADLQKSDQNMFTQVTGSPCDISPFEVSQEFYYPTEDLLTKWKGKRAIDNYVEA